jgi:F-type H+-transporting ATPase subunit c
MDYFTAVALGAAFSLPLAVLVAAYAQGKAIERALEAIARQPEAAGSIRTTLIIGLALIESLVLYVLVMAMAFIAPKMPTFQQMLQYIKR